MSVQSIMQCTAAILMTIAVLPIMAAVFAILLPTAYYLFFRYMKASTELRRLVQLSYTPIINNVSELVSG